VARVFAQAGCQQVAARLALRDAQQPERLAQPPRDAERRVRPPERAFLSLPDEWEMQARPDERQWGQQDAAQRARPVWWLRPAR
jgi:hypothetical protein